MGCVKKLFQTKPGGTVFGNILRAVGDHFTGGVYTAVFPRPPRGGNYRISIPSGIIGFGDPSNAGYSPFNPSNNSRPSESTFFGLPPFVPNENFGTSSNSFTNIFNAPSDAPSGIILNQEDTISTNSSDSNPYGLPGHIMNLVTNVLDHVNDGFDIEDIPNATIDTLDSYFDGNPASGLLESLGIDFSTGEVQDSGLLQQTTGVHIATQTIAAPVNDWGINGSIGGVDFNIGETNDNEPVEQDQSFLDKAKDWVNNNVEVTIGIISTVFLGIGYLIYKRYKRY